MGTFGTTARRNLLLLPVMLAIVGVPAYASDDEPNTTQQVQQSDPDDEQAIVVIGRRIIVAPLQEVPVEQEYDEAIIDSYAVHDIGELYDALRTENGDANPAVLLNGQPVANPGDISDIPIEAVDKVELLPRGAAQRIGGAVGQRAYNIVLKPSVKRATLTAAHEFATEGGWNNDRGDATLTYIKGQDRVNVVVRGAQSSDLRESERDLLPLPELVPYAPIGNIVPLFGAEVDPAFSSFVGQPVSAIALSGSDANPTFGSLLAGANAPNPGDQQFYRSLRGPSRPVEMAVSGNKTLSEKLWLSFNARRNWLTSDYYYGLPRARFSVPASNNFTLFDSNVAVAISDPSRPLLSHSESTGTSASATLNSNLGKWRSTVTGSWEQRDRTYSSQFTGSFETGGNIVADDANPFDGSIAALIPIAHRLSDSVNRTTRVQADAEGPLAQLWAGPLRGRVNGGATWLSFEAQDSFGDRDIARHEYGVGAGLTLPLTGDDFVAGASEVSADVGIVDLGEYGTLDRHAFSFSWQALDWLRLVASETKEDRAIMLELVSAPQVTVPNVPYFDPLTEQTSYVTLIYGGGGNLDNEAWRVRSLSLSATPLQKYRVLLSAEYQVTDIDNQFGVLPPPSSAIVAAFPDRFQRDASGTLILVDSRSVNFARQHGSSLRFAANATIPFSQATFVQTDAGRRRIAPWSLQFNATHAIQLESRSIIREGLPEIDLLADGAVGISGGQQRHFSTLGLALSKGGSGLRINAQRRGASYLLIGTLEDPDRLTFQPITKVDVKAFADVGEVLHQSTWAKNLRMTLALDNAFNRRQDVFDRDGTTPIAFQPVRRDAVGRTFEIEIRKTF